MQEIAKRIKEAEAFKEGQGEAWLHGVKKNEKRLKEMYVFFFFKMSYCSEKHGSVNLFTPYFSLFLVNTEELV